MAHIERRRIRRPDSSGRLRVVIRYRVRCRDESGRQHCETNMGLVDAERREAEIGGLATALAVIGPPLGIGIAMLRHRLFDVEFAPSRTIVYAVLPLLIAGAGLCGCRVWSAVDRGWLPACGGPDRGVRAAGRHQPECSAACRGSVPVRPPV
jgi:hypothetical protein